MSVISISGINGSGQQAHKIKIGAVAKHFKISVDLLRLYEREGLVVPIKSPKGTRYFTEQDYEWIGMVLRLVREARLNFAAIRHLLSLTRCWEMRGCEFKKRERCPATKDRTSPCWTNRASYADPEDKSLCSNMPDCYECNVYRAVPATQSLNALLGSKSLTSLHA